MLCAVASIIGGFLLLVWSSYRREARRAARGDGPFAPEGKVRWGSRGGSSAGA